MRRLLVAVVGVIAATAFWALPAMSANPTPPFTQCPAVGLDTSCAVLIVVNPGGSLSFFTDPTQQPFDGIEDTLVGIQNNSGAPLSSISLTGTSGAFGFEGDGLCTATPSPSGCPFGPTGYEGPNTAFANISSDFNSGDVQFPTALANNASTYFSLEGPATAVTGGTIGHIEICKTLASDGLVGIAGPGVTNPATASFQYNVTDQTGTQQVTVRANAPGNGVACSAPITVHVAPDASGIGHVSVEEIVPSFASISALSYTTNYDGATTVVAPPLPAPNPLTNVPVLPSSDIANETRVDYSNVLVTGFIEVCKNPAPRSGLASGQFSFRIRAGFNSIDNTWAFEDNIQVGLNQCSAPIAVPAGMVNVQENGTGVFITDVQQTIGGSTSSILGSLHTDNSVDVQVTPSTNPGNETLVRFFDALSTLKICKIGDQNALGTFTGPATFTIAGAPGATTATVVAAPAPGNCVQIPGSIVPGSTLSIAEAASVGAQVEDISLNGSSVPAPDADLAAGTVSFVALNGANVITYTDVLAPPVLVKICKAGAAAGSVIGLSLHGVVSTTSNPSGFGAAATDTAASITIPSGGGTACTDTLGPFAYGSTVAVTETPPAGTALSGASGSGNMTQPTVSGNVASFVVGTFGSGTEFIAIATLTNGAAGTTPTPSGLSSPPTTKGGGSGGSSSSSSSSNSGGGVLAAQPTPVSATSLTPTPIVVSTPKVSSQLHLKLISARVVLVKQSGLLNRWLGIRLNGGSATAKVRIQLLGLHGKVIKTMIRTVKTGKFVRVMKVGATVRKIKVTPLPIA